MTTKRTGKVYKKLAVKAGVYRQTSVDPYTGQMITETVYVSPQYLRQSAWNTMQMMQRGLDVPVCLDHQESAVPKRRNADVDGWLANEMRSSVGLLKSVKYDPASESHEYIFEVRDPEIAKKIDLGIIKRVSPNFHNEFSPGDGTRWPNVVAHLALTFRPKDGKQSPDSMEAAAVTAPGQKRFSVLTPARNSKVVIVPMHKLEFSVLRSMVRKQKNGEWHFRSTDYLFRFNSHAEFESWLKRKYTKTLRMSVAGKTNYVLYFAVVHAPVGGVHINGRLYKGGQFIPTVNLDGLDQQTRQKIQESTSQRTAARSAKAAQYRNEGEDWHQAVARHAGEHSSRPISEDDERAAARRLKSLQAHHGDQVMERIASLAGQESAQLAKLSPDDPKAEHLKRRLRAYARMSEHMQGAGKAPAAQAVAKEDWREKIKGQPRWQAVDTLRQQDINDLTFDEYENVKKWDNEETGANDKEFEGRSPMRLNRGKVSFRVAHDRNMSEQYSEFLREQYDKAKEKAFLEGKNFIGGKPHWAMTLGEYERETGNSSEEYKQLMNRALSEGKIDERGNIVGSKSTQAAAQDDSGHRNALAEMAGASSDVDTAVRSRLHNEMKTELADRMKDDWQHLTDEQKAEFERKINALPHTALGDPDEYGEYSDRETSPEAQQLIDEVNDTAYEARRSNEAKAYEQKRIDQHKKDIEEADKRGMVFERPDNHNNPGDLKVNPDKVHLAKQAMEEYRAKAKQHLIDSQNQLNKKEAARSKRMYRAMSDAADMIQDQVGEIEKHAPAMNKIAEAVSGASRLASSGNFDKSTSADKPGLAVDDKAKAKEIANRNVKNVALKIVSEKQDLKKSTPETVKKMFEDIAANANAGLIDPSKLYRTHEDQKGLGYAKVAEIKGKMDGFYRDLAQRLSSGADPVATAAWAEQQIQRIHPLSDGVGRTSKLMSNWILHNAGINPPKYPESGSYFKNMHDESGFAKDFAGWVNGTPPAGDASAQAAPGASPAAASQAPEAQALSQAQPVANEAVGDSGAATENRASNDALSGKPAKSDNPVKKVLGFDADSIDDIHSKLVENNPTDAYSQSHTKAAASVMINNHIGSFLRDIDNKIKSNEPITPDEEAAYDAIQQDKHFGDLREKLSDLGGAGWQAANSDIIPAKIEPSHIAGHEETYKNVIKDSRIESDSLAHDSHKMNYEDHKRKLDDIQKQLDENGKARSRLSDLEYKAQRNGNKALANKYAKQVEELDTKSSRLVDQRGEVIDAANYSQSQMARTDPALPEFVKFAHFATKGRYTGEPNEKMRKAIAPRAVQFAKQVGYDAEVGEEIAKELSKGLRVADKEGFDRIVRRSAGLVENQKKAERQRASVKAMEGYGDLSEMDKNTIENNISAGSIDSEIERIAKDKIEKNKAVAEGNRKYEQEQKQAGERKAQIEKMVADIAAGKAPENIKSSDMRAAVENSMKRKGDFRPSKGDTHRKFPKSHYTKDDMATRYNFQKLVKERGYWTDGKAIVAVPDDIRAASKGGEGAVPSIDPILQAADKAKSKARIVGEATPDDTNSFHKYLIEDQYGNQMQVPKDTHASVVSLHPDAEMYIPEVSDGVGNLVYYKKDGKTVGVAVPLTRGDKEPKATVEDIKHIKDFAEPGPYKPEQMKEAGDWIAHPDMKTKVRIRSEGNKIAKHYKIDGYHGTYATEGKAKEAAKELLSYIHGTEEGDETGDHIFKPKGQKTQADEGTRKKLDFHQSLNDHIASRQYKKSKVMQKGDIPEGKYSTKPGEYEVTEHDDESSPFKIVSSPYSRSGGMLKKEPTHSVVHKKSGAVLGSWNDVASAKKHAALAEGLHSWDFDKPDHFADKKEEGETLKAKLKKAEDVIERDEYDPEVGIPARDKNKLSPGAAVTFSKDGSDLSGKVIGSESAGGGLRYKVKTKSGTVYVKPGDIKFAIVHAPVGGTDIDGKHYLGGQFTPGQGGSSGGVVAKADSHVQQEKKQFHVKADAHARNLKLKPQGVNVQGIGKVNGLVHGDLAVHPVAGNWVVSHIPTGKRVALDGSKNAAVKKAYLLHHGLDWSEPGPKHLARLRDVTRGEIPRDLPEHKLSPHGDLPGKHVSITKEAATAFMSHEPNYMDAREKYIKKNGTFDESGELRSIPINTDEWREYIPGYVGTNAHVVHEAASNANKKFFGEMLQKMKGKGNNRTVILAGGGGSGKGTSVAKHFDESEYPIRIDQVSGHYDSLMEQFNKIKESGMTPEMVFVDRPPEDAWKGVVGRAMGSLKKGEHPRTVPHSVAIQANLDARNVALRVAQENPDIRLRVIDNHNVDDSKILDNPSDIIRHLTKQTYNKDDIMKGAKEYVDELEKHGSIPSHVAKGLRGEA